VDIKAYLDSRANMSAPAAPSAKATGTIPEPTIEQRDTDGAS
jgi:hypothetical protein